MGHHSRACVSSSVTEYGALMITKLVAIASVIVVVALVWLLATNQLLRLKSGLLFEVGFWLGPWTFTGWLFLVVVVVLLSWATLKLLPK